MPRVTVSELLHLGLAESIQLAEDRWDSFAAHPGLVETSPELLAELERRLAELDENPETGEPWDQVKVRLLVPQT
jgi:putative addiction module component (TIGR02574 family)